MAKSWLRSQYKCILGLDQGLGKTVVSAATLSDLPIRKTLIVCPASVCINWQRELKKWADIDAEIYKRNARPNVNTLIVSWASLSKVFQWFKPEHLILDEVQYMKSQKAKRTKVGMKLAKEAKFVWALSGTPIPNKPIEIWPILYSCGITHLPYRDFGYKFCNGWKTPWNTEDFSGSSNERLLSDIISKKMLRITKDMAKLQLPSKTYQVIALDLPIDKREKNFKLSDLEKLDTPVNFVGLTEVMKLQGERKVKPALAHIKDLLEHEQKLLVFANHRAVISQLQEGLAGEFKHVVLVGDTTMKARQKAVDSFQNDPSVRVFLGNVEACKTGLTLTAASRAVIVESSWAPKDIEQLVDRMHRMGQHKPVIAQILTTHKSIDEYQLRRALEKLEVIDQIIKPTAQAVLDVINRGEDMNEQQSERLVAAFESIATSLDSIARIGVAKPTQKDLKALRNGTVSTTAADKPATAEAKEESTVVSEEIVETAQNSSESNDTASAEVVEASLDDCRAAMKDLLTTKGKDICKEHLTACGADSLSKLKAEDYTKFVNLCKGSM